MEFNTLTKRLADRYDIDPTAYEADERLVAVSPTESAPLAGGADGAMDAMGEKSDYQSYPPAMPPIDPKTYEIITQADQLADWVARAQAGGVVAVDTETDGLDTMQCRLVGVSLALAPGEAAYIPLLHGAGDALDLGDAPSDDQQQLSLKVVCETLAPLLADKAVLKILQNAKFDLAVLARHGMVVAPLDDTMLMSYALDAGAHGHGMDELSEIYLQHKPIALSNLLGKGKNKITFDRVPMDVAAAYAGEDADITLRLWMCLRPRLVAENMMGLYQGLERPLVPVVQMMEQAGIMVDRATLSRLSAEFAQKMAALEAEIYRLAGENFNIASPKQLGDILFGKMGLAGGKKTKTGAWSTGADVLETLAVGGSDLSAQVLAWRALAKLKSTYTDALPEFINPDTGRVHTSYALAATTTGRLASSDPNLQNIPIRTEDGRRIRTAFIAAPGNVLVSADYSQIELRLLAHIAEIENLRQAFADGLDIHAMTASEIFSVPLAEMTPEVRRRAKAINFGIIYGISAFGLANQLGIARGEASAYIQAYFARFPGIKTYMEAAKAEAHAQGYVSTLFGRRVHLREINAKIPARRAFAERAAINAPIQGTAADIIRRAMIAIPPALAGAGLDEAQMLLQVHDELIFEVPQSQADALIKLVRKVMENACAPRLTLSVPLVVDAKAAKNWDEAH